MFTEEEPEMHTDSNHEAIRVHANDRRPSMGSLRNSSGRKSASGKKRVTYSNSKRVTYSNSKRGSDKKKSRPIIKSKRSKSKSSIGSHLSK